MNERSVLKFLNMRMFVIGESVQVKNEEKKNSLKSIVIKPNKDPVIFAEC